ncbi:MAG: endolytic transglycosylase MltG [Nitrospirota bacterium]|nr:endolytic transglycosylase MltG [Nitrospirota bacterium]
MRTLLRILGLLVLTLTALGAVGGGWLAIVYNRPLAAAGATEQIIEVKSGSSLRTTANLLLTRGIIADALPVEIMGRLTGAAQKIKPGEYRLSPSMTPRRVLNAMVDGDVLLHPITLPEGLTVREVMSRLADAGFGQVPDYQALIQDPELAARFGVVTDGVKVPFEGYFFPDTYKFARGTRPEVIVETMLRRLDEVFTPEREHARGLLGWTRHQVLTMASVIEKETGAPDERERISAVFHNRLMIGMRLQTDPTVIYATPDYDGDIRYRDLRRDDPYNTYRHKGLPPGPIANPGEAAIHAALFPANDPALYFVSRGDGTHVFSETVEQHNRAVREYQRRRR